MLTKAVQELSAKVTVLEAQVANTKPKTINNNKKLFFFQKKNICEASDNKDPLTPEK